MRHKLLLKLLVLWGISLTILLGFVLIFIRNSTLKPAKDRALTTAQIVRDALTTLMVSGAIDKRGIFLEQIKNVQGVKEIRVIRGEAVIKQYGRGLYSERPRDPLEWEVLSKGKVKEEIVEDINKVLYRVVIPYKAEPSPSVNCLQCHKVKPGEVLGAISITMDLTHYRNFGIFVFSGLVTIALIVAFITFLIVYGNIKNVSTFIDELGKVFSAFEKGIFSERLNTEKLKGEIEDFGNKVNKVLDILDNAFKDIRRKVYTLLGYSIMETENELRDTEKVIDELVRISQFKKTVELDDSLQEVYKRLESVLSNYMSLDKFSIYEVTDDNKIEKVTVHGRDMWCSEIILKDSNECRAKRTGQDVDSEEFECVCPNFAYCSEKNSDKKFCYYCIPVNVGGRVGNVVQVVYESELKEFVKLLIPYIKGYLREATPVIESKKLMEKLKMQSYVDGLTGAFNRRFLEELVEKIVAQTLRRNSNLGILMIDVDFFKQVNDTYGHDAGDEVLRQIAKLIKENIRKSDYLIRYGGEEFLVLLSDVKEGYAEKVAEKLRKIIEDTPITLPNGQTIRKTVSIGVSEFPKDCEGKFWKCVKFADVALYRAKEEGRNRVVRFKPEMWQEKEY